MKKIISVLLALFVFATNFNAVNANTANLNSSGNSTGGFDGVSNKRPGKVKNYTVLEQISGNPVIELAIATRDLALDLLKRDNAIFRIKDARQLVKTNENTGAIGLAIYETNDDGSRGSLISVQQVVIGTSRSSRKIFISQDLGRFNTLNPTKNIEIDVLNTDRSVAGTYKATINAVNPEGQVATVQTNTFDCATITTEECIRKFFIEKVNVVPDSTRNRAATVVQNQFTDNIEIKVPVVRKFVKFKAGRRKLNVNSDNNDNSGVSPAAFGETLDISRIRLGNDVSDFANFRYDPTGGVNNGHFILSSGVNGNPVSDNFFFADTGKLGIGLRPEAFLDVRGGTATMPQMRLNQGTLSTALVDGALEFDGNDLYLTKNGVRNAIGATGAQGPQGPAGPQGPQGPQGPAGQDGSDADVSNGAVIDGQLAFTNNGSFLYPNGAQDGYVWTSDANGLASWQPPMTSNGVLNNITINNGVVNNVTINDVAINNGSVKNVTIDNSTFNNGDITNSNITDNTINNNVVNGTLTFTNNGSIEGDLVVNGMVTATKFMGDGSMLTNLPASAINGSVANALSAVNADNATTANTANFANQAADAQNSLNAQLAQDALAAFSLKAPNNSTAVSVTNNGNVTVEAGDLIVNGTVTADKFIGDGSMLTNVSASSSLTAANADNATTANFADEAALAKFASNVDGGLIKNSTIMGGMINGAVLKNVTIPGGSNIMVSKVVSPDSTIEVFTTDNSGNAEIGEGDLTVNGTVTADKFIGDASMLTNISAANITGKVASAALADKAAKADEAALATNAMTAVNADNATTANFADEAALAKFASNVDGGLVKNSTIMGGTINGATLVNVNISGNPNINLSKLVSPDGSPNPAVSVDNDGNTTFSNDIDVKDGWINSERLTTTNLVSIMRNDLGPVGTSTNDGYRIFQVQRPEAGLPFQDTISDYVVFEKTDANHAPVDGGFAFLNTDKDDNTTISMIIEGDGQVGIGGIENPSEALEVNGNVKADKFIGDGSMLTNISGANVTGKVASAANADRAASASIANLAIQARNAQNSVNAQNAVNATNASNVSGGTIINSSIRNGVINGATLVNVSIPGGSNVMVSKVTSPDGAIPALTADNAGDIEIGFGNLVVNGTVTADKFIGDGSMLTNLSAGNLTGTVANATNAVNAINAQNATNVNGGNITNSTIQGGTINGAVLVNSRISSLSAPDGDPNPAVSVDNAGKTTFAGDIQGMNINLSKNLNAWNVTGRDYVRVGSDVIMGSGSRNYTFNNNKRPTGDLRVKGDNDDALLFTDASEDSVGVGTATPSEKLEVVGNVKADKFIGDGSMLTNIAPANINGPVTNAINATNATNVTGGVVNGVTLVNTIISSLSAPDGDPNPAVSVDNAGKTTFAGDIQGMNVNLSKNLNAWNVTGRDYVRVGSDVIMGSGSRNYTFNNNKRPTGDLRVKGDNDDALLFTDASEDSVGVGTATPSEKLEVVGNVKADNFIGANFTATGNVNIGGDLEVTGNAHFNENVEIDGDLDVHDLHVADKLAIGHAMKLDPREDPPVGTAANLRGMIYYDNSEALCMHINGAWTKITGPGTCE